MLGKAYNLFLRGEPLVHQFLFELLVEPVFIAAVRNFEELPIELRQLTRPKVTALQEREAFQEMGAFPDYEAFCAGAH